MNLEQIGLQLYSLRNEMSADFFGTLKAVSDMGYRNVEIAGFYGKSAERLKHDLFGFGLQCVSAHIGSAELLTNPKGIAEDLVCLGAKYAVIPYEPRENMFGGKGYEEFLKNVRTISETLRKFGIELLYHNHEHEFETHQGKYLLEKLYEDLPAGVLNAEPDVCWIRYAGVDPVHFLKCFPFRCPVVHLKDYFGRREENNFEFRPLGSGTADIKAVVAAACESGTKFFIVEQDSFAENAALECVRESLEYLKKI